MAVLPIRDHAGNTLVDLRVVAEEELTHLVEQVPVPASLVVPRLTVNDEVLAFRWWSPSEPISDDMSPLDAEIARRVLHASAN
jgi:hypothetical protein